MTSKPSVLLVEDSATNRKLIGGMLEAYGCAVTLASSGPAAIEALTAHIGHGFDIVLMDIEMPDLNGDAASRLIRAYEAAHPDVRRVPIVALTANTGPDHVARYRATGMDAHVAKPIDWPTLFATIGALTNKSDRP